MKNETLCCSGVIFYEITRPLTVKRSLSDDRYNRDVKIRIWTCTSHKNNEERIKIITDEAHGIARHKSEREVLEESFKVHFE